MHSLRKQGSIRKCNGAKSSDPGHKMFKEKPGGKCNKGSGALRARPHSAKHPTCERN